MSAIRSHLALVALVLLASCGQHHAVVERSVEDDIDPRGEATQSYKQSVSLESENDLERADRLVRERNFDDAIEIYRGLYRNATSDEVRAKALLKWAQAEGTLFNPARDLDDAIARLDLLLREFPDSELRFQAQEERTRMQELLDSSAKH